MAVALSLIRASGNEKPAPGDLSHGAGWCKLSSAWVGNHLGHEPGRCRVAGSFSVLAFSVLPMPGKRKVGFCRVLSGSAPSLCHLWGVRERLASLQFGNRRSNTTFPNILPPGDGPLWPGFADFC